MDKKNFGKALAAVLILAAVVLGIRMAMAGPMEASRLREEQEALAFLLPGSGEFTQAPYDGEDPAITRIFKSDLGCVIETRVDGYVDSIRLMVGVSNEGKVEGITVRQMYETLGLGTQALQDYHFLMQFLHTTGDAEISQNVDAMTGATVTSKAIARGVNSAVAYVTGADVATGATSWGG